MPRSFASPHPTTGWARTDVRYYRIYGADLQNDVRFMALTMDQRGAWITLAHVASISSDAGILKDRQTAELLLRRDGAAAPAELLDGLLAAGMVTIGEDGAVDFPVGIDWTMRKPSDEPERVRERVQRHRDSKRGGDVTPPVTPGNDRGEERRGDKKRGSTARARANGGGYDSLIVEDGS